MTMTFSFRNLNLANVTAASGSNRLKPGRYVVRVKGAEIRETKSRGHQVVVELADDASGGSISDYINVNVPTSEKATQIGLERLKSLLVNSGHNNPDQPGDIKSLVGLRVGVNVVEDEWTDKDGNKRPSSTVHYYYKAEDAPTPNDRGGKSVAADDEIPF